MRQKERIGVIKNDFHLKVRLALSGVHSVEILNAKAQRSRGTEKFQSSIYVFFVSFVSFCKIWVELQPLSAYWLFYHSVLP